MKQDWMIVMCILLALGGILFYDQVLTVFHGMSVLEAMQTIVQFVLHVAVVTIISYVVFTAPALIKPWVRMLTKRQRSMQRGRAIAQQTPSRKQSAPRLNRDQVLFWMMNQVMQARQNGKQPSHQDDRPRIQWE